MSGLPVVAWLGGPAATFEAALTARGDVRTAAVAAGQSLPRKDLSRMYPSTMQDAVSIVHARLEENKKKAAASKQKSKSKSGAPHTPSDSHFPGARAGGGEPSAFWMYIEDYFRDFTQEDLRALLPLLRDPREDPALLVPPCGRRIEDEHQQRKQVAAKAAAEAAKAAAAAFRGDWDSGAVDSKPSGGGSPDAERRSSRLVSRHCKEEEQRRQWDLEAQALAAASAAEQAELAAAAATARAMAVVPTTASGEPAVQLLDVLPEQQLALLVQQLTDLLRLTGRQPLDTEGRPSVQAAMDKLRGFVLAAGGNGSAAGLDPATRRELQDWLQQQLAELAGKIGGSLPALPPWAGRPPMHGSSAEAAEGAGAVGAGTLGVTCDSPAAQVPSSAYLHPYTELMLAHPVQQHTVQNATEVQAHEPPGCVSRQATLVPPDAAACLENGGEAAGGTAGGAAGGCEAATPRASFLTAATPRSFSTLAEVPSVADLSTLTEAQHTDAADDGGAAGMADTAGTAGQDSPALGAADGGLAAAADGDGTPADVAAAAAAAGADGLSGGGLGLPAARTGSRARAVSNYALLAGKKSSNRVATGPPKKAVRSSIVKHEHEAAAQHPVARAVAAMVASGEPDRPAGEQFMASVTPPGPSLLAAAPEDEVLAEMLALQNELMQQAAANRARLAPALAGVLAEMGERRAAAEQRDREEEVVKAWIMKMREIKRLQHRQRREEAHQEALAAKKQSIMASPRPGEWPNAQQSV